MVQHLCQAMSRRLKRGEVMVLNREHLVKKREGMTNKRLMMKIVGRYQLKIWLLLLLEEGQKKKIR